VHPGMIIQESSVDGFVKINKRDNMKYGILLIVAIFLGGCTSTPEKATSRPTLKFSQPERAEKFYHQWAVENQGTKKFPTQAEVDKWEKGK